jgi:uridine kinase
MYEKLNKDLFHNFLAVIYSIFVILVPPSENWYVWSFVLCAVLFISLLDRHKIAYALSALFSVVYLITFLATPHIESEPLKNLIFTTFEGILLFVVYVLYKYGIKSNSVYKKKEHATIIGIGGDSGVGKSTLKNSLIDLLGEQNIVPIESDGDHKWGRGDQSWDTITHLNPKANYLYRQAQYLKALKNGSSIERVEYDHHTGQLTAPKKVYANDFILVAGLHPFYLPQTRKLIDVKIYLDTQEKLRRHWKIKRDVSLRGYTLDKIMDQITMREVDAEKYIHPQMHYADLVIRFFSDDDYTAGDVTVDPKLKLKIMLKLDVEVEGLVEALESYGHEIEHVYDADMKYQHITFKDHVDKDELIAISERFIEHIDELVNGHTIKWVSGYHGVIQLMTLALLSHNMKKGEDYDL